jgi:hypothetical protein
MKNAFSILLSLFTVGTYGQKIIPLESLNQNKSITSETSIIYGSFIQRLGFSSGGFPQDIRIVNRETNEIYAFRVKPAYKSAKENSFCFYIMPGNYFILNYWWTQSKWYGGAMYAEPIFKGIDATGDFNAKVNSGEINIEDLERYEISIKGKTVNYLGTWHFDKGPVSFTNEKHTLDSIMRKAYKNVNFEESIINLPK